jgi:hypothetical protein
MWGVFNNKQGFGKETRKGIVPNGGAVRNKEGLSEGSAKEYVYSKGVGEEEADRKEGTCARDGTVCESAD